MRNAGLDEAQAGIKIAWRNINNLRYADDTTLVAENEELKSLLMKVKEESEKVCFFTLLFHFHQVINAGEGVEKREPSYTFSKRLFSSSSLSAIRVVSSAYLRLLIFLLAILIPACASSSPAFLMMHSAYKLNKQGDNIQPWCTPFPIWSQSVVPYPVLTVASWLAYRFLKRQVRWSGIPISFRIFHSLLWSTQSKALLLLTTCNGHHFLCLLLSLDNPSPALLPMMSVCICVFNKFNSDDVTLLVKNLSTR